jgi:hypothetical protein
MGDVPASTAALRVGGDDLDPDEITRLLGAKPTHAHRKGDQTSPKIPKLVRRSGLWLIESGWEDGNQLEAQIRGILFAPDR